MNPSFPTASFPTGEPAGGLDRRRIEHAVAGARVRDLHVTLVGAGSGGFPVMQQLAMLGVRRWDLFDPDVLQPHDLVKHPARRADLARSKVDVAQEWLLDRNPTAEVRSHTADVVTVPELLGGSLARTDLVVCAVDTAGARGFVNERCVEHQVPCATGTVFRTGMGGTVHLYLPGYSGCFACLESWTRTHGHDIDGAADLTGDERHRVYGLGERDYSASGLATDIALVASFHAALCTSLLCAGASPVVPPVTFTWLTFSTRRVPGVFDARFAAERVLLRPQRDCYLRCALPRRSTGTRRPASRHGGRGSGSPWV